MQAQYLQPGELIDYTPGSAVDAGDVVVLGTLVCVAPRDIAAGALGQLATTGVHRLPKVTGAISAGALVYWAAAGNPVGGTAGSGAATTTATSNTLAGKAVAAAASGDATVDVLLNR